MSRNNQYSRQPRSSGDSGYSRVANVTSKGDGATTSGHVKVVIRVRPPNTAESEGKYKNIVRVLDEHVLVFDPKEEASEDFYHGSRRIGRDLNKRKNRDVRFAFDHVYDCQSHNEDIYQSTTKVVLDGLLDGYNCSVFAYGATGAGKTYTMLGSNQSPGVMFLTMMDLYHRIDQMKDDKTVDVAVSYLEVYNEQICDLLVPKGYLPLREDPQKGVIVSGLSLHKPKSAEELLQMLNFGNQKRTQHPTDANAESSRSHAVFQVFVRQRDRTANISADVRVAKMSLIDLAGSERATVTTNRGNRFREGANINKSLLALGNCINALAEGKSKGYIPYRNSKLTRLLKDSLGGNCRTVMIAAVSPSSMSFEDTYNTLNYANRAKNIKAELKRNVLSVDFHISKYAKIVDELRKEVCELRDKLKSYEDGTLAVSVPISTSTDNSEITRLSSEMCVVFEDRYNIRQELLELEGKDRDLAIRLHTKEKCLLRVKAIHSHSDEKASGKISHMIETTRLKQERVMSSKQKLKTRMDQNANRLKQVEQQVTAASKNGTPPDLLECRLKMHHQKIDLHDTRRHVRCLQNLVSFQQNQANSTEKLVMSLLQAYRQVYFILRGHHLITNDLVSQFEAIQHLVEGEREVAWADQSTQDNQLFTDTDKPLLDHILKFPTLSSRSSRRSTLCMKTPTARHTVPGTPSTPVMTPEIFHKPPGICTPGPPRCPIPIMDLSRVPTTTPTPAPTVTNTENRTSNSSIKSNNTNIVASSEPEIKPQSSKKFTIEGVKLPVTPAAQSQALHTPRHYNTDNEKRATSCQRPTSCIKESQLPPYILQVVNPNRIQTPHRPVQHSQQKTDMDGTFTMDGIEPLPSSPDVIEQVESCNKSEMINPGSEQTPHKHDLIQNSHLEPQTLCATIPSIDSHTVTLTMNTPAHDHRPLNTGTITKPRPNLSDTVTRPNLSDTVTRPNLSDTVTRPNLSDTVTRPNLSDTVTRPNLSDTVTRPNLSHTVTRPSMLGHRVNNISNDTTSMSNPTVSNNTTVTKCKRTIDENTEPSLTMKRAIDFSQSSPSPAGTLTFAEAVRSPGSILSRQQYSPVQRSPLARRDNLPDADKTINTNNSKKQCTAENSIPRRKMAESSRHMGSARSVLGSHQTRTQKSLHRMGLPSVEDMRESGSKSVTKSQPPKYMKLTLSATSKRTNNQRHSSRSQSMSRLPQPGLPRPGRVGFF